ncbi:unnamed protein product [Ambrosiozyma monospora]|uniref:2-dehydropantolactone reductase n=1 Tax=Ambrosiozyma monospora TaxID=43982 RepID=A0A9W6YQF2_AMBMO|nr:unnamed protein product [Ambrosiozyma monospora]
MTITDRFTIPSTGDKIPILGFGSGTKWQHKKKGANGGPEKSHDAIDEDLIAALVQAIQHGFIHLDTAETYTTRRDVGIAIKRSGVPREKLWITDKYQPRAIGKDGLPRGPYASVVEALEFMQIEYIDLFLFHTEYLNSRYTLEQAWREMEKLYEEGKVKNIGVSNHTVKRLKEIQKFAKVQPAVNQIEFHPYLQNQSTGIIEYAKKNGILIEAYAPLAPIARAPGGPLDKLLDDLAEKYGKTTSQILLKWVHKQGIVTITTTSNEGRLDQIQKVLSFDISDEDQKAITDVGNSHFYRAFQMSPLPTYDDQLKKERGLPLDNQ